MELRIESNTADGEIATGSEGYDTEIEGYKRVKAIVGVMVTVKTHELHNE